MAKEVENLYQGHDSIPRKWKDKLKKRWLRLSAQSVDRTGVLSKIQGLKQGDASQLLFEHTYRTLNNYVDDIFDKDNRLETLIFQKQIKDNLKKFAMFKAKEFTNYLNVEEDHKKVFQIYHNQLTSESTMVARSMRTVKDLREYLEDADLYPNLKYKSSLSANPRQAHKQYYGIVKPINDSFWNNHLPPLDWGCKCRIEQSDEAVSDTKDIETHTLPKGMVGNAWTKKRVFEDNHPFFTTHKKKQSKLNLLQKKYAQELPEEQLYKKNGKRIYLSPSHENGSKEAFVNIKTAHELAGFGAKFPYRKIQLPAFMDGDGIKNYDFLFDELPADLKTLEKEGLQTTRSAIQKALKQKVKVLVLRDTATTGFENLAEVKANTVEELRYLKHRLNDLKKVLIIGEGSDVMEVIDIKKAILKNR